jgi:hypothetical protein
MTPTLQNVLSHDSDSPRGRAVMGSQKESLCEQWCERIRTPSGSSGAQRPKPLSLGSAHPPLSKLGCSHRKRRDASLDFAIGRTRPGRLRFLSACSPSTPRRPAVVILWSSTPRAGSTDVTKIWTPDLFYIRSRRTYKQKSSEASLRFPCEKTGAESGERVVAWVLRWSRIGRGTAAYTLSGPSDVHRDLR